MYIIYVNLMKYSLIGGVPTSLEETGEQWDFPNGWAPLECIIVEGLLKLKTQAAFKKAFEIANKWIQSNYIGYKTFKKMFEKVSTYDNIIQFIIHYTLCLYSLFA